MHLRSSFLKARAANDASAIAEYAKMTMHAEDL
jgi:hypothetical protein